MNIKRILTPLLIILLLFSIVVMGAPTYVNLGPTSEITGDVGVPDGSGYYINDILFSTLGLIDISTLAKTDGGIIVGDGTNFVLETGDTARASLGLTIGTHVQAYDAGLLNLAGLTYASDSFIKVTAEDVYAIRTIAETKTDLSLNYVENLKVKLDATSAPGTGNDNTEGYAVGSRWIDVTNDKEYVALDVSTGAAVWTETTGAGGGATTFTGLTDTPANYTGSSLKHVRVNVGETALEFVTLGGGGDMLKATYDTDTDGDIDVAAGGTEKSSWTQYAIPYLSNTTVFGEIPIGTAEYALTVAAGATGYDWTLFDLSLYYLKTEIDTQGELETIWGDTLMNDLIDDTTPDLGGELDAGAHTIGFTQQSTTGDGTTTIDWTIGNKFKFTFGAQNDTFTFTAPTNPCNILLMLIQDGTGSRTATWPGTVKWAGGTAPTLTTTAAGIDICSFYWDGTNYFGVASLAFAVP